jgi:hypothetical protein
MNLRELLILISRNRATEVHLAVNAPIELRIDRTLQRVNLPGAGAGRRRTGNAVRMTRAPSGCDRPRTIRSGALCRRSGHRNIQ